MAFTLIQHPDLEFLAERFAARLRQRPQGLSPLEPEPLIVQTPGMEKWLALQCARLNGSFARVETLTPVQFIMKLGFLVLDQREERTLFEKDILPWALYRLLRQEIEAGAPAVAELGRYVAHSVETEDLRLFSLARALADLYDQYMLYRPHWLETWETGAGVPELAGPEEVWQAHLWRKLQQEAGDTPTRADFFKRLQARLAGTQPGKSLPKRVFLFGMSLLPPRFLRIFELLGDILPVELYLQRPSLHYWGDLKRDSAVAKSGLQATGNRLLANWGETGKAFLDLLEDLAHHAPDTWDESAYEPQPRPHLLGWIQQDILLCRESNTEPVALPADASVRVARCTGPLREVEVLHDLLLDALVELPDLTPSDILVVSPDLDTYAPLVDQVFGSAASRSGASLPYTIADRPSLVENRALRLATDVLAAVGGGFSPAELVPLFEEASDLAGNPVEPEDHELLTAWCVQSGIRRDWSGAELTWQAGLDRLFAGFAVDGDDPLDTPAGRLFPLPAGVGQKAELLGNLAAFVRSLAELAALKGTPRVWEDWVALTLPLLVNLLTGGGEGTEDSPLAALSAAVERVRERVDTAGLRDKPLSWDLVLRALVDELSLPAAGGNFLSGRLTVCGMVPMRSLPFRVIAVLGLAQGKFPRHNEQPEYDLMRDRPEPGDRDTLNADRYLFLELLLSARDRFLVTAGGLTDGGDAAPLSSLAVGLVEWLDKEYLLDGIPAGQAVTVHYPLSPASPRYLSNQGSDRLLTTWNKAWFEPPAPPADVKPFWQWRRTPELAPEFRVVVGRRLLAQLSDPLAAFVEKGLGAVAARDEEELPRTELFRLDNLDEYLLRDAVLDEVRRDDPHSVDRLAASGGLPPGEPGRWLRKKEESALESRLRRARVELGGEAVYQLVRFRHEAATPPGGWSLVHEAVVARRGDRQVLLDAGRVKAKRRLAFSMVHAFSNLQTPITSVFVALDKTLTLAPYSQDEALRRLLAWQALADRALTQPLPYTLEAAWAWCESPEDPPSDRLAAAWKALQKDKAYDARLQAVWDGYESFADAGLENLFVQCAEVLF